MNKQLIKDGFGWGFILWLIGYFLGIVFFMLVPTDMIGWVVTPFGIAITLWVLFKQIRSTEFNHYLKIGVIWAVLAILLDYVFLVLLFKPDDGYYKLDVYLYYTFTLALPVLLGWYKSRSVQNS